MFQQIKDSDGKAYAILGGATARISILLSYIIEVINQDGITETNSVNYDLTDCDLNAYCFRQGDQDIKSAQILKTDGGNGGVQIVIDAATTQELAQEPQQTVFIDLELNFKRDIPNTTKQAGDTEKMRYAIAIHGR